jgi:hypothetical protein
MKLLRGWRVLGESVLMGIRTRGSLTAKPVRRERVPNFALDLLPLGLD